MADKNNYKFFLQPVAKDGTVGAVKDIEKDFDGCRYRYCKGLETRGSAKNIYTENYPEADGLRVYHPSDNSLPVTYNETSVTLCLIFIGENRRSTFNGFCELLKSSRLYYWDTARHKKALLIPDGEISPSEDTVKGVTYIDVEFKFKNTWGRTYDCDDSGTIS